MVPGGDPENEGEDGVKGGVEGEAGPEGVDAEAVVADGEAEAAEGGGVSHGAGGTGLAGAADGLFGFGPALVSQSLGRPTGVGDAEIDDADGCDCARLPFAEDGAGADLDLSGTRPRLDEEEKLSADLLSAEGALRVGGGGQAEMRRPIGGDIGRRAGLAFVPGEGLPLPGQEEHAGPGHPHRREDADREAGGEAKGAARHGREDNRRLDQPNRRAASRMSHHQRASAGMITAAMRPAWGRV